MAKSKMGKKASLITYTINATSEIIIRPGDCVLMRADEPNKPPFVARVVRLEVDEEDNVMVRVMWYYRPEDSIQGRRLFHGVKELFESDHYDLQSARSIERKCTVHSFKNYKDLNDVGPDDFFSRFYYSATNGRVINPKRVTVYCKCEMPHNPDDLMVSCEGCDDWFHPACVGLKNEIALRMDHFFCPDCAADDEDDNEDDDDDDDGEEEEEDMIEKDI